MKASLAIAGAVFLAGCAPQASAPPAGTRLKIGNDGAEIEVSHAGIRSYLTSAAYRGWTAEPAVRDSSQNSPHGKVRVYFNKTGHDALKADALPLPIGSMIVKDLFLADGVTHSGYAVMMKTSEASWTWWEAFHTNLEAPAVFAVDAPACTGCHTQAGSKDQVRTPPP